MKNKELHIRILKKVDFSVFCVDSSQKTYYDPTMGVVLPYSSGQQVKKSIINTLLNELDIEYAPLIFTFAKEGEKLKQKELIQTCDPSYFDQLIGGWMTAPDKKNTEKDDDDTLVLSRRSPLSISAMSPVHPLLASVAIEEVITFDRTESNTESMVVKDGKKILEGDELIKFLEQSNSKLTKRKAAAFKAKRATGLFKIDIAIDLKKLFRVPTRINDIEIKQSTINKLMESGWKKINIGSGEFLELPKEHHEEVANAVAESIIRWRITSNQSRTFDVMSTLTTVVANRADVISNSVYGELYNDKNDKNRAKLVIDQSNPNAKFFSNNILKGYLTDVETSASANDQAVEYIKNSILDYYNE